MSSLPPPGATALEYRAALLAGTCTARAGIAAYLDQLRALDAQLGALLDLCADSALEEADAIDARLRAGAAPRPLEGVPFTAKSNICTLAGRTTAGSRALADYHAPSEATAVRRLRAAGAVLVAKTNMDEFGMGSSTENSAFHPTRNPWDLARVPGGSSGGAAALAASHGWAVHLGSDTGGSVRQPAAFCGVTGLKPSYGRVSRSGLVAFGSSLDQIGPLARDAADAAATLAAMAGWDPLDATTRTFDAAMALAPEPPRGELPRRLGVPREILTLAIDPEIAAAVRAALAVLEAEGCTVHEVSLPHTAQANACYQVIAPAEASSNLARYAGVHTGYRSPGARTLDALYRESRGAGFGAEVKRRILLGTFVLSAGHAEAYYGRALRVRSRIREDFARAFETVDALVTPTSPLTPFELGERSADPLALYACDVLTVPASLAGLPALSVPCGLSARGLPIGLQLIGPVGGEATVLALAARYQAHTDHHRALAPVARSADVVPRGPGASDGEVRP